eukprot:965111-Prorocentrum_minimum.AAC.1
MPHGHHLRPPLHLRGRVRLRVEELGGVRGGGFLPRHPRHRQTGGVAAPPGPPSPGSSVRSPLGGSARPPLGSSVRPPHGGLAVIP